MGKARLTERPALTMRPTPVTIQRRLLPLLLLILAGSLHAQTPSAAASVTPAPIPIEMLVRAPYLERVRLSPDGKSIAGLNHQPDGTTNLILLTLGQAGIMTLKGSEGTNPYKFSWQNDEWLLVHSVIDKIYAGDLRAFNRNDFKHNILLGSSNVAIVGRPKARPKSLILWSDNRDFEGLSGKTIQLKEVSFDDFVVRGGEVVRRRPYHARYPELEDKHGTVLGYDSDVAGELALCYRSVKGELQALLYEATTKRWKPLEFDASLTTILAVEADHRHLWLSEYHPAEGFQVRRYSLETGEREPAVVTDPLFNPGEGSVHFSVLDNRLAGITYTQRRVKSVWFNPKYAGLQAAVDRLLPKTDNLLVDTDTKERYFLYYSFSDQNPGSYQLLDSEEGTLKTFTLVSPWLAGFTFAPTHPVKFKARDGLELEGYLTVPRGASALNKVPLVVLCHGGPTARDTWGFDRDAQFLASRGYAVLQPNYRGSSGYQPAISQEWKYDYRKMHEDVTDATKTFRQLDLIDRNRIAIMGASFGGYLAVAGAAFESDLYRCAITNSGVFDWERLTKAAKWNGRPGEYEALTVHVGQPGKNREFFDRISPMAAIDRIKIPVFIAHGREDSTVGLDQSTKLAAQLKRRNIPTETFFPKEEAHGFRSPENLLEYYSRLEVFFARNLRN